MLDHKRFSAAAAADNCKVCGNTGMRIKKDGVDYGLGFLPKERLFWDVIEIEYRVIYYEALSRFELALPLLEIGFDVDSPHRPYS